MPLIVDEFEALVHAQLEYMAREHPEVIPPYGHGMLGGVKWPAFPPGHPSRSDPLAWEGGYLCNCGEIFARSHANGGTRAAQRALLEHQGVRVVE